MVGEPSRRKASSSSHEEKAADSAAVAGYIDGSRDFGVCGFLPLDDRCIAKARDSSTGECDRWDTIDHFLIGEGCHAIRESLRLLGIEESKLVVTRRDSHFVCDLLVVPSFHGAPGNMPPWAIEFLREQFLGSSSLPKSRRRIYVSRSKASGRKIANEEEILPILTSRGFVCSELEEMSLSAQIELFSKAEAVVAPHGAGLTNLVWCAPHTKVLEIFSPLYVNFCYWAIASVTQADYYYLLGNAEGVVNDVYDARYFLEDILVDPIALQKTLSDMNSLAYPPF